MFYYQHNAQSELIGKSTENFPGAWYCDLDFDINRYRIIVSTVNEKGKILRWKSNVRNGDKADSDKQKLEEIVTITLPKLEKSDDNINGRTVFLEDCLVEIVLQVYNMEAVLVSEGNLGSAVGRLMAERVAAGKLTFAELPASLKEECAQLLIEMGMGHLVPVDFGGTMEG